MKNMRNIVAAIVMVTVLSVSTTFADGIVVAGKDGIVVAGRASQKQKADSCTSGSTRTNSGILVAGGIVVAGFTGIVVAGFTGIIIAGATGNGQTNCGIVVAG